jgi:hypothetical protein
LNRENQSKISLFKTVALLHDNTRWPAFRNYSVRGSASPIQCPRWLHATHNQLKFLE